MVLHGKTFYFRNILLWGILRSAGKGDRGKKGTKEMKEDEEYIRKKTAPG
jgi:hypothetical protein